MQVRRARKLFWNGNQRNIIRRKSGHDPKSPQPRCAPCKPGRHRAKTLTTPSPPPLTTHLPSWLQTTAHTPSPRIRRWLVISWVQLRFSKDQNRRLASCPAETSSLPSGERKSEDMADGWASIVYVHWPRTNSSAGDFYRSWILVEKGTHHYLRQRIGCTDPHDHW